MKWFGFKEGFMVLVCFLGFICCVVCMNRYPQYCIWKLVAQENQLAVSHSSGGCCHGTWSIFNNFS